MKSEKEKSFAGELYDPLDTNLRTERMKARKILNKFNKTKPGDSKKEEKKS